MYIISKKITFKNIITLLLILNINITIITETFFFYLNFVNVKIDLWLNAYKVIYQIGTIERHKHWWRDYNETLMVI